MKKWMNVSPVNLKKEKRLFMHLRCIESATCIYHNKTASCNTFCNALFFPSTKTIQSISQISSVFDSKKAMITFIFRVKVSSEVANTRQERSSHLFWLYDIWWGGLPHHKLWKTLWPATRFFLFHEKMCHSLCYKRGTLTKTPSVFLLKSTLLDIRKFDAMSHNKYHCGCFNCFVRTKCSSCFAQLQDRSFQDHSATRDHYAQCQVFIRKI